MATLACILMAAFGFAIMLYVIAQCVALLVLPGRWRLMAAVPGVLVAIAVLRCELDPASNTGFLWELFELTGWFSGTTVALMLLLHARRRVCNRSYGDVDASRSE